MRAAIYTRISSDPTGQRAGVTRQLDDCLALAERLGWTVVDSFDDNDISAFNGKTRPGFEAMLDAISRGEIGAIICWHPDRLYRSLKDLVRLLDVSAGIDIRTVNGGDLDLSTSTGRMLATIIGSVSTNEVEHKAERRKRANAQRRAAGKFNTEGYRPFGYTSDGALMEPEATALRQAARDVKTGRSLRSIALDWNAQGITTSRGKKWTNLRLRRVLMNPTYAGLVTYQDKVIGEGKWESLWDKDFHYALCAFLTDESRRPAVSFERKYVGSGIYRCGKCGNPLYAQRRQGSEHSVSYICRASAHLGRSVAPLDAFVETLVLNLLRRSDIGRRLTKREDIDVDMLVAQRDGLTAQKDKLATLLIEGVLTEIGVRRESEKLQQQIDGITKVLTAATRTSPAAALLTDGVDKVGEHWAAASPDIRGKVINELMTVTVLPVPHGCRGVDRATGEINPEFIEITPR